MQPHAVSRTNAFGSLPVELFLNCLDQLVGTRDGLLPIAYEPSHSVTKALRALTLVSKTVYILASRYLYTHCLYLNDVTRHMHFRRTLGLDLGLHPLALEYGQAGRNEALFTEASLPSHISSLFISPARTDRCGRKGTPRVRLPQVIDLCLSIGATVKRLAIDFNPVYVPASEQVALKPFSSDRNIFLHMPLLEELVCSYDASDYFPYPPPRLKRLAMTTNDMEPSHLDFWFALSSLEMLFVIRPKLLTTAHVDKMFTRYRGKRLDVVFVDVNGNHGTPVGTRDWEEGDRVVLWEADVPTSFYGDDEDLVLADDWIWTCGVKGDLWGREKRRMMCWSEVERLLAGTP
ncbi:hypothetical protein BU23DRAFT_557300 [Bimuria novae-zelandiae CBS 107.79]|uniref:F-box domain-containing protein n=1 Tax=Bimuria novae-zelandiae CBS 107.79 TaxID=1447943 RepID=A0A6A5UZ27_9PLEO|nr:hypothetical protein BU23DRAFT_557300 [Bimuria novae-zelandiae CBS 107.79]